jgi:hypothetical protein
MWSWTLATPEWSIRRRNRAQGLCALLLSEFFSVYVTHTLPFFSLLYVISALADISPPLSGYHRHPFTSKGEAGCTD